MLKILLTGRSGFIGRNLMEYFTRMPNKYCIDSPSHSQLDLTDESEVKKFLERGNYDVVLHAAMYNRDYNHPDMLSESLRIFFNLEKCSSLYGRMFYFGSGAEFDKTQDMINIKEDEFGSSIPKNYYGLAKYIMGRLALESHNIYNLRLFAVYGRYEHWPTKFISNACCRALYGMPVTIQRNVVFDYLYIDDLCRIVEEFIKITPKYRHYNVASGRKTDLCSLAEKVIKISGKDLDIMVAEPGFKPEYSANIKRMLGEISCNFTDIDTGIRLLYNWYEDNISLIDKTVLVKQ
jgi:GDP-L-fucose synthase